MILYNASTSNGLRNYARFLTNTSTNTYTDLDLTAALNMYYGEVIQEIIQAQDGWDFQAETATADLVADQQEYTLPTDILKIKRIEISYDGTNWTPVTFMDVNETSSATDTTTVGNNFQKSEPYADLMDKSIMLYPTPSANATGGLKIWYSKGVDDLSADTDEPVFQNRFHKVLCYGAARDYFEKYLQITGNDGKRTKANANFKAMMEDLKSFYNTHNQDRDYVLKTTNEYNDEYIVN